jgi:CBS domain-containing protein
MRNAAPLIALDAVVIDTETTGLDPFSARIVEIGAVRLVGGRIKPADTFQRLVRPHIPIPTAASAIHQIDDAKVANASRFSEIWPELSKYIDDSIVIGHALGFDLAVLKRECERSGIAFRLPRTLDTRLLAQLAEPNLDGFTLERLASWLGIELAQRHSALGDALTTARIFTALVPKLRDGGIRTFGEAAQACRTMANVLDEQYRAGWAEAAEAPDRVDAERALGRIDSYPYRHRIRDVMQTPARSVTADTSLAKALAQLMADRISSLYVRPAQGDHKDSRASETGIITERDVLRAVSEYGSDALDIPVEKLMNKPLVVIPADAFVYRAIGRMSRLGVRHLGVVDEAGEVIGALSARDLLRLRASEAVSLGDQIDEACDVHGLGAAWAKLPQAVASLLAEGVNVLDVAAVISSELGALTRQAAIIAEERMRGAGHGEPTCAYAVAVLGSAGRGESLLAMDQDNALVFADGAPGSPEDAWFEKLGLHVADILHEVGVPYCKGGVMAKNPQWRGSVATWRKRINDWIRASKPEALLSVDIFFDLRPVHGDGRLCTTLWRDAFDAARGEIAFIKLLADASDSAENAFGLLRQFKTREGRIDLKKSGLFAVVSTARVLAIGHHVVERSTLARLAGVKALAIGAESDIDALLEAQETFLDLLVAQQIEDIRRGTPPSNAVAVKRLSSNDRNQLRTALEAVQHLDDLTRDLLFKS